MPIPSYHMDTLPFAQDTTWSGLDDAGQPSPPRPPCQVILCHNRLQSYTDVQNLMAHELVHAYDHCRIPDMDFSNCTHHACTEVGFRGTLVALRAAKGARGIGGQATREPGRVRREGARRRTAHSGLGGQA